MGLFLNKVKYVNYLIDIRLGNSSITPDIAATMAQYTPSPEASSRSCSSWPCWLTVRRDAAGMLFIPLLNASLDKVSGVRLHVHAKGPFRLLRLNGKEEIGKAAVTDGAYQVLELKNLRAWEMVVLTRKPETCRKTAKSTTEKRKK